MKGDRPKATFRTALALILIAMLSAAILMIPSDVVQKVKSLIIIKKQIRAKSGHYPAVLTLAIGRSVR